MSPRTREDARLAAAYVTCAWATSPAVAREYLALRRGHVDAYSAMAVSDEERRFAAALRYVTDVAGAALAELEAAR